jgi:plasmid maintenance system antidote protein VapI
LKKLNLKKFMVETGLTQQDIAFIADVTDRQVRSWINGSAPLPQPVALLLEAYAGGWISAGWIEKLLRKQLPSLR